jgi:hypothetical protein
MWILILIMALRLPTLPDYFWALFCVFATIDAMVTLYKIFRDE